MDARSLEPASTVSFPDWAEAVFGNGLARHFMRHYNLRGLGTPAGDDEQRVDRRAGERRRPQACANQPSSGTGRGQLGPSNTFKYPLHGGTGGLFERFVPHIREYPRLNRALLQVDTEARRLRFADGSDDTYDLLITTLPIPELLRMLGPVSTLLECGPGFAAQPRAGGRCGRSQVLHDKQVLGVLPRAGRSVLPRICWGTTSTHTAGSARCATRTGSRAPRTAAGHVAGVSAPQQ